MITVSLARIEVLTLGIGILQRLLHELRKAGILTEDLALPEGSDEDLEGTYRGLCRLPGSPDSRRRRIDFLAVPYSSRGAALIYYTVRSMLLGSYRHLTLLLQNRVMTL